MKKEDAIRKRLHDIIDKADSKTLKAMDSVLGATITDKWENKEFLDDLTNAWKEYINGGKVYTHEEVMEIAKRSLKNAKRRSA